MNANGKSYSAPTLTRAGSVVRRTLGHPDGMKFEPDGTAEWPFYLRPTA